MLVIGDQLLTYRELAGAILGGPGSFLPLFLTVPAEADVGQKGAPLTPALEAKSGCKL